MQTRMLIVAIVAAMPIAAPAQNTLPGLENFTLDQSQPPRPTPTPVPTPAPSATAVPVPPPAVLPSAAPTATPSSPPTASASRTPAARPTAAPSAVPAAAPSAAPPATPLPTPSVTAAPTPAATATPTPGGATRPAWPLWIAIGAALALLAGGAFWWWHRRQAAAAAAMWDEPTPLPVEEPAPPPPAPSPSVPAAPAVPAATPPVPPVTKAPGGLITTAMRPELAFDLRPVTAAIDALRASVEFELSVVNVGRAPAFDVILESWLIGAGNDPRGELAPFLASPPGEALLPAFALPASANIDVAAQAATPREALPTINAGERKLFVPLIGVRATWRDSRGQAGAAATAFFVGVAREGQDRLAPLALDRGTRVYRTLATRHFAG